ncbi:class I SAM-dependent methyltransferase [Xiashengella succiniciproducens]|uniref:Class I SAM-dependent methyltransferase n=1 Tax=Xiashengella succiniciproducens TaxID=2949635 RepID=A0A9J6ZRZ0_9BACT|nr:class I SAM-dependent methyltransferase [Alkaliflexus sp. Ai-910]URW80455.1 class I SAM-dependent methyltransferase [Alkaliflexus sp. Ai-910]
MNKEKQNIHDFDLSMIYSFFSNTERQGPGSPEETLKALGFIRGLDERSKIADIGCGTGGQTMVLGANMPGEIVGVDSWPAFIEQFNKNARSKGLHRRARGVVGDMADLPFEEGELDLIWSEGAIYNIGFERGLSAWRKFLKPGGYIAVTENTWFRGDRPGEIQQFWDSIYPEMDGIANKVAQMQDAGYLPVATFMLPETVWTDYYTWQAERLKSFQQEHEGNPAAAGFIETMRYEAELYSKYMQYYGYMFYIGKKL